MNRQDLAAAVAEETGLSSQQASAAVNAALTAIAGSLAQGDPVTLPGFGTFERRHRAARAGRNPQTGEPMEIAAGFTPAFKAAAALRRQVADAATD